MRRDEAIQVPSPIAILVRGIAVHHHLQDAQQSLRHLEVALIAGLVKWDQDLVEQPPPGVSRRLRRVIVAWDWLIVWRHPAPREAGSTTIRPADRNRRPQPEEEALLALC